MRVGKQMLFGKAYIFLGGKTIFFGVGILKKYIGGLKNEVFLLWVVRQNLDKGGTILEVVKFSLCLWVAKKIKDGKVYGGSKI